MAQVSYHGEFPEGADTIIQHGYEFGREGSVTVKEPGLIAKFSGNRFFKTTDSDKAEVEQGKAEAEEAEAETLRAYLTAENVPFHHKLGLTKLQGLKDEHDAAKAKALED